MTVEDFVYIQVPLCDCFSISDMAFSSSSGKFLFTVEQLELIRRLRNSGLNKAQVLQAFDSFEQLDHQLGDVYSIPLTLAAQAQSLQQLALSNVCTGGSAEPCPSEVVHLSTNVSVSATCSQSVLSSSAAQIFNCKQLTVTGPNQDCTKSELPKFRPILPCMHSPAAASTDNVGTRQLREVSSHHQQRDQHCFMAVNGQGPLTADSMSSSVSSCTACDVGSPTVVNMPSSPGQTALNGFHTSPTSHPQNSEEGEVDSEELLHFLSLGESACCEEIKAFVVEHNIKQQQIASLAGVSQPYVSRYLKQEFSSMSERCCRAIKKWYLAYRKRPEAIGPAASAAIQNAMALKKLAMSQTNCCNGFPSSPCCPADMADVVSSVIRRERFVFRPIHLDVLERSFAADSYPSYDRREQIAQLCNVALERELFRPLVDKEKMTLQTVSNWFSNKRKDLRKGPKEEMMENLAPPSPAFHRPLACNTDSPQLSVAVTSIISDIMTTLSNSPDINNQSFPAMQDVYSIATPQIAVSDIGC